MSSDSESKDSEDGVRFKTESVRKCYQSHDYKRDSGSIHSRSRSYSRDRERRKLKHSRRRSDSSTSEEDYRRQSYTKDRHTSKKQRYRRDERESREYKREMPKSSTDQVRTTSKTTSSSKSSKVESKVEDEVKIIGPALPPRSSNKDSHSTKNIHSTKLPDKSTHTQNISERKNKIEDIKLRLETEIDTQKIGGQDTLPANKLTNAKKSEETITVGPQLPPHMMSTKKEGEAHNKVSHSPSLSVQFSNKDEEPQIGPSFPCEALSSEVNGEKNKAAIGPALPPHLLQSQDGERKLDLEEPGSGTSNNKESVIGPSLPSETSNTETNPEENKTVIGPALPPYLLQPRSKESKEDLEESASSDKESQIGPSLPSENSDIQTNPEETKAVIGPALPPHLLQKNYGEETSPPPDPVKDNDKPVIGPSLPPHLRGTLEQKPNEPIEEEEEDDECFGPLPDSEARCSKVQLALEERALRLKLDQLDPTEDQQPVREQWMLELPAAKAKIGLGPRQFRQKQGPDMSDRSSWTDTPQDRSKKNTDKGSPKVDLQKEAEREAMKKRDKEQASMAKKHKRDKNSLLEIHQKKLKKQKQDEGPSERRPFSREIDLQVNRFDDAQKKAILKKAQLLDTRFSTGESKFL